MKVYIPKAINHSAPYHTGWLCKPGYFHSSYETAQKDLTLVEEPKDAEVILYTGLGMYNDYQSPNRSSNDTFIKSIIETRDLEKTLVVAVSGAALYLAEKYDLPLVSSPGNRVNHAVMFYNNTTACSDSTHPFAIDFSSIIDDCLVIAKGWNLENRTYIRTKVDDDKSIENIDVIYWKTENILFCLGYLGGTYIKEYENSCRDVIREAVNTIRNKQNASSYPRD